MNSCDGCRFCCWAWAVDGFKPALSHCAHECDRGCAVHGSARQPQMCALFRCPYLERDGFHRPDTFQAALAETAIGNFIPIVPLTITAATANRLIRETRTVPASVILDDRWFDTILPLDKNPDGTWSSGDPKPWNPQTQDPRC